MRKLGNFTRCSKVHGEEKKKVIGAFKGSIETIKKL